MKALLIASPASGVGKTTVTCALAAALQARGLRVALFKAGPDYLDPSHHAAVTGRPSRNLDGWMLRGRPGVLDALARTGEADIALLEGMMGLFDGRDPDDLAGSSAELALMLDLPVVLVVDASAMARSAAAVVEGFARHVPGVRVAGAIFNRVGSAGHADLLRRALRHCPADLGLRAFGALPHRPDLAMPERHLGLVSAALTDLSSRHAALAAWAAEGLDLDALLDLAAPLPLLRPSPPPPPSLSVRIGIAQDAAFHFYYPDNLDLLREAGAVLVPFSPLQDASLPPGLAGLLLGGGYPEEHAETLSRNTLLHADIRRLAESGRPVYAECGGLMYLGRLLHVAGQAHAMCGVLDLESEMTDRMQILGYREITTTAPSPLGPAGVTFRGHEFHHSRLSAPPREARPIYQGGEGFLHHDSVLASYVHAHWGAAPDIPRAFVEACRRHSSS